MNVRKFLFATLLLLLTQSLSAQSGADTTSGENTPNFLPGVTAVVTDNFPKVNLILEGNSAYWRNLKQSDFQITENGQPVQITAFSGNRSKHHIKIALLFDRSADMGNQVNADKTTLNFASEAMSLLMRSMESASDSFILVNYATGIDNSDLNNNVEVLEMILASQQAEGERAVFDALQVGLETLLPHEGRKVIVAIVGGNDNASDTPPRTVMLAANILKIPIHIIAFESVGEKYLKEISVSSGGSFTRISSPFQLDAAIIDLSERIQRVSELQYISPDSTKISTRKRTIEIVFQPEFQPSQKLITSYKLSTPPRNNQQDEAKVTVITTVPKNRDPILMITAVMVSLLIVIGFIYWRNRGNISDQIIPAITRIEFGKPQTFKMKIYVNVPLKDHPVKFTIYSTSGAPLLSEVFPGRKKRFTINYYELGFGVYTCSITNCGVESERKEFVVQNE